MAFRIAMGLGWSDEYLASTLDFRPSHSLNPEQEAVRCMDDWPSVGS